MAEQEAGVLRESRDAILSCFVIPPPITSETLRLKQRGRMEPEPYSYDWWRQLGFDSALAGSAARAVAAPATEKERARRHEGLGNHLTRFDRALTLIA